MFRERNIIIFVVVSIFLGAVYFAAVNLLDKLWDNVPIVFYGRVIDEDGNPAPDVVVSGYVQAERRLSVPVMGVDNSTKWDVSAKTDAHGNFTIHGGHGHALYLRSVTASEYIGFRGGEYYYGTRWTCLTPYYSDPKHPKVFYIWKERGGGHHQMKYVDVRSKSDGRQYVFDFAKCWEYEGSDHPGDMRVSVSEEDDGNGRKELVFNMEAIDGGFVRYSGPFPYEAPADGYAPSLTFHLSLKEKNNTGDPAGYFYLKSRDGQVYSVFMITVMHRHNPTISISFRINAAGSRVLEP